MIRVKYWWSSFRLISWRWVAFLASPSTVSSAIALTPLLLLFPWFWRWWLLIRQVLYNFNLSSFLILIVLLDFNLKLNHFLLKLPDSISFTSILDYSSLWAPFMRLSDVCLVSWWIQDIKEAFWSVPLVLRIRKIFMCWEIIAFAPTKVVLPRFRTSHINIHPNFA
jgi:hypothetical protein